MEVLSNQPAISPPSPSLTNPDMILPSYEPSRNSPHSSYFESQPPPSLPLASSPTLQDDNDLRRRSDASLDDFEIPHWEGLGPETIDDFPSPVGSPFPEEEEGPLSHAALTKRAERILANAKTRLTVRRPYCCNLETHFLILDGRTWRAISIVHATRSSSPLQLQCHPLPIVALIKCQDTHPPQRMGIVRQGPSRPLSTASSIPLLHHRLVATDIQESLARPQCRLRCTRETHHMACLARG